MFETSFWLLIKTLAYNIILPLIPGILFLWIFFGQKLHGILLYLLWRFVGVGIVAFSLFNLQFVRFWIGLSEYFLILWILIVILISKILYKKLAFKEYSLTLKVKNIFSQIKESFFSLSKIEKIFTLILWIFWISFLIVTFVHTTSFPTYADDSFGNWNSPTYNIYQDGGVKIFWEKTEILWRWRLGYPIYIPIYKSTVSHFIWSFNDVYINLWQWLVFFWLLLFVFSITFTKTKNIFYSILPVGLLTALPLVYFHATEWYMELACATYSVLTIWALRKFLEEKEYSYISLALLLGFILSHIKNDWLLWYFAGIIITFGIILLVSKQLKVFLQWFLKNKAAIYSSLFYFIFFFLPFLMVKFFYWLWFNQSAGQWTSDNVWLTIHSEIFNQFKSIFFGMDNYNVVIIIILLMWIFWYLYKKHDTKTLFLFLTPIVIFIIFVLVFLLTENYIFAMNQTTINRVFTMSFVILFAFIWLFFYKEWKN